MCRTLILAGPSVACVMGAGVAAEPRGELYQLELPNSGSMLQLLQTFAVDITGQGIAWDPQHPAVLYGIHRPQREVVVSRLPIDEQPR